MNYRRLLALIQYAAMYATFSINTATGELILTTPDGYAGPTFSIDVDGCLEVSV